MRTSQHGSVYGQQSNRETFGLISRTLEYLYPIILIGLLPSAQYPLMYVLSGGAIQLFNLVLGRTHRLAPRLATVVRILVNLVGLYVVMLLHGPSSGGSWLLGLPLIVGGGSLLPSRWDSPRPERDGFLFVLIFSVLIGALQLLIGASIGQACVGIAGCLFTGVINLRIVAEFRANNHRLAAQHNKVLAMRTDLERQGHLAIVGTMAAKIAHEINNPLTYVNLNIRFIEDRLDPSLLDDELQETLEGIRLGAQQITDAVQEFRGSVLSQEFVVTPVDLNDVILGGVQICKALDDKVDLVLDLQPTAKVLGEEHQLLQAVINLLDNAVEPNQANGWHVIHIKLFEEGNEAVIEVEDNGSAIPPEQRERIFEPLFTTKRSSGGMGLGLAVVRSIVQRHNGTVECVESPLGGMKFRFAIPIMEADQSLSETFVESPRPERAVGVRTVLVIDDEPLNCRVLQRALSQHHVITATSGHEGLDLLRKHAVDVILCDIIMPGLSGLDVHKHLATESPKYVENFAFITGGIFTPDIESYLSNLNVQCFLKPLDIDAIHEFVKASSPRGARDVHAIEREPRAP